MADGLYSYFKQHFRLISCDSEYQTVAGDMPHVLCFVYRDIVTGETWRCENKEDILKLPFDNRNTCYLVFNAVAESKAWLAWGITLPEYIIDLWIEAKNISQTGSGTYKGFNSMLSVARRFKIPEEFIMLDNEKETMRDLILENESWSNQEWRSIIDYCEKDTILTGKLLVPICNAIQQKFSDRQLLHIAQQILCRGLAKAYEGLIYQNGIPMHLESYNKYHKHWTKARWRFLTAKNKDLNVYDEEGAFKQDKFEQLLKDIGVIDYWPRTKTGKCSTAGEVLDEYENSHPKIKELRAVKKILESDRLQGFAVGADGRSRGDHNFYATVTGRATPSSTDNPFVASRWTRNFIAAPEGKVLVYADFKHEEPCIQAALSGDKNLLEAVKEDVYLYTANETGATHGVNDPTRLKKIRNQYKVAFLAMSYGMGYRSVAIQLGVTEPQAKEIISAIKHVYKDYYSWIWKTVQMFKIKGQMTTLHGWCRSCKGVQKLNHRSLENWPIQSHGAEILYWSVINLIRSNFKICATVHDAVFVELDDDEHLKDKLAELSAILARCTDDIIGMPIKIDGIEDKKIIRGRWVQDDEQAKELYDEIMKYIAEVA